MRTKSKNKFLGSILSIVAVILCFGFLLTGCGGNKDTVSTISLSEAKTIIVNALEIDEPQTQLMTLAEEQSNRDVFVKFGKSKVSLNGRADMGENSQDTMQTIIVDKNGGNWNKYVLEDKLMYAGLGEMTTLEYFDGEYVFTNYNGNISVTEPSSSVVGILQNYSAQLLIFDKMFSDVAFETLYKNEVEKRNNDNGFSLTINIDTYEFWIFLMKQLAGDNYQEIINSISETLVNKLKNEATTQLVVNFDNNEDMQNLTLSMTSFSQSDDTIIPTTQTITAEEYTGEITEPQWVTDYLAEQQ